MKLLPANDSSTLVFEAYGWETEWADNLSCRIGTRFTAPDGRTVYLMLAAVCKHKNSPKSIKESPYAFLGIVVHAYTEDDRPYNERVLRDLVDSHFLYTRAGIVEYINSKFNTDYKSVGIPKVA